MAQFLLNIFIAFLWTLLGDQDRFYLSTFIRGYLVGILIVWLIHQFFGGKFYLYKFWAIFKLLMTFNIELITSSITTSHYILFKPSAVNPGVVSYHTKLQENWQITLLTMLIILTPGSVVLRISDDNSTLFIHALNQSEKENDKLLKSIQNYERLIKEVIYS
ncbi:Na+/H+ antiporter subunit E [Macrococcus hajekii]|uniref:Na+/H+ antiporter subunit E n=1 Tax=Macrococcus hajekii TaxID=198482 RepID=A0A4R6BMZ9_9STAP|nr:Na+/H+ antiporter subunit E [Macrococcus hajekii]TDM03206.1 Na+/H+ antiporter subunit E [Macrococcus hajekii]GGA96877.1 putative antiporter subunit mnhE2 [Macrococcus hajekii]